jgi:transglutaminase superfamily protein
MRVIPGERVPPRLKLVLAAEILGIYARVRYRMQRADIRDVVMSIRSRPPVRPAELEEGSLAARVVAARLANAVGRTLRVLPTDSRCLVQALTLSWLLSARGISSRLVIGAHSRPEFAAHAWVEHHGMAVLPPEDFDESRLLEI